MLCAFASLVAVAVAVGHSQVPQRFEVASVKVSPPLPPGGARVIAGTAPPGGRWISQNAPLIDILRTVFPEYRLRGQIVAPEWVQRTRFDINARGQGEPSRTQMIEMMKQLLTDRFAMKARTEQREIEVQALTLARGDGRLGGALRPSSVDCQVVAAARAKGESPQGPGGRPLCIALSAEQPSGLVRVSGGGAVVAHLIAMIQGAVSEPIIDRTGLTGLYDLDLEFNPELGGLGTAPADAPGSSLSSALQEQLGLRLQRQKSAMTVLVIDNLEMPTPD